VTVTTWEARDLPVLRAIVDMSELGAWHMEPEQIAEHTGLELETVQAGLRALVMEDPPFFEYSDNTCFGQLQREIGGIRNPTGHARRTVGTWPKPEDRVVEMIAMLWEAAEREPNPDERSALRKTAEWLAGVGGSVAAGILTSVATGGG
jgi:hypothetical protein